MISLFVRRFSYFFRNIDSLCGEFIRFFVIFVFLRFYSVIFCVCFCGIFFHGVLGRRSSGFDPDVVLVVYFFAHAWVNFTAHGQLDMHKLYSCMRAHWRLCFA